MRVLVTRTELAADRTADALRSAGYDPVVLPLTELKDTGAKMPDQTYDGYLFTSGNALEVLSRRGWICPDTGSVAYCVGDQTAAEAKKRGFVDIRSAGGNAQDLVELIKKDRDSETRSLLYPTAVDRSLDFNKALSEFGVCVEVTEIYENRPVFPSTETVFGALQETGAGSVFFYSRKSATHACEILSETSGVHGLGDLSAICISAKTAEPVLMYPWQAVYVAEEPTEQSMVSKLNQIFSAN
ncbi:MAG: uroporphyrinogen-III synthase [Pseudomonadota bacterium]